jgi:hypothetical protein
VTAVARSPALAASWSASWRTIAAVVRLVGQRLQVDLHPWPQDGGDRVTGEQRWRAEGPPQLGQGPAQRPERVVGVAEQQLGQLPAPGRPVGQQHAWQLRCDVARSRR